MEAAPLSNREVLRHVIEIAEALAHAHEHRVVHRDLKSANIVITKEGRAKVLDFGLAKGISDSEADEVTRSKGSITTPGVLIGTLAYMAPEQLQGKPADARSDIWALGIVLYEMLTGRVPFQGPSQATVVTAILRDPPNPLPKELRPDTPPDLQRIVLRCLEKDPEKRYASAAEVARDCAACEQRLTSEVTGHAIVLRPVVMTAVAVLIIAGTMGAWLWMRGAGARWARNEALPEITRQTEAGHLYDAYRLILQAQKYLPGDPRLKEALNRITLPLSINSSPPGALVYVNAYANPQPTWELLGQTPLKQVRVPYGLMRMRFSKQGYETFEGAPFGGGVIADMARGLPLDSVGEHPPGMVRVPGSNFARPRFPAVVLSDYWLDKYEVTNRQFREFMDNGGYSKREYWTQPLINNGRELSWEEAQALLRDTTGRPGPATWELGAYPAGRDDFPVNGVSWYEAAAYCQLLGKTLPTIYHWYKAAAQGQLSDIMEFSNFGPDGPARVGSYAGLGAYGTYDMAGNVKEWVWNATGDKRYTLGGGWGEPRYMFQAPDARRPFEREPTQGFRCARYSTPPDPAALAPVTPKAQFTAPPPVSDAVFAAYRSVYAYDRTDLQAKIEWLDDSSPYWRKEKVSFDAAYGAERVSAYLLLPRNAAPPYQAVIWFPGSDALLWRTSDSLASQFFFDFLPRSGRAVVYPVYKGMYERFVRPARTKNERRDMMIQWAKDLGRTVDYLQTRPDIDGQRIAYYGLSLGAVNGPLFGALDARFKALVLLGAGIPWDDALPEMNVVNFAPRCRVPTLMVSGKDDFLFPLEESQRPFFRLLGAPERDKRHALLDGGHLPPDRTALIREVLDWLDRYLGPVRPANASTASPNPGSR